MGSWRGDTYVLDPEFKKAMSMSIGHKSLSFSSQVEDFTSLKRSSKVFYACFGNGAQRRGRGGGGGREWSYCAPEEVYFFPLS